MLMTIKGGTIADKLPEAGLVHVELTWWTVKLQFNLSKGRKSPTARGERE